MGTRRPLSIGAALEQHRAALEACRRCGHPADVRPIVSLARAPKAMLVGQAPGQVERGGGAPFSGRAGGTLFRWLARAGLDEESARRALYIAAVTRCYPGPSPSGRGDRVPAPHERDACAEWLEAELRIIRPKLLIPVGKLAIAGFLPNAPLSELIGREHEVTHAGGTSIAIPLPHPSGASSWIHQDDHLALLDRAIGLLRVRFAQLRLVPSTS